MYFLGCTGVHFAAQLHTTWTLRTEIGKIKYVCDDGDMINEEGALYLSFNLL